MTRQQTIGLRGTPGRRRFLQCLAVGAASAAWPARAAEPAPAEPPRAAGRKLDLKIGEGFGDAPPENIRAVLLSAAETLWEHCPQTRWEVPGFFIFNSTESPITLYDHRSDERIAIGLTTKGTYWAQFAFQFAHEFCHALAGHSNDWREKRARIRGPKPNGWFEESLCETASLFALRAMGRRWATDAPYPNWKSYGKSLTGYAADRLAASARDLPADMSFVDWFAMHEASLRASGSQRAKNNVVARLLLPLFEAEPSGWEAVPWCNLGPIDPQQSLRTYFAEWLAHAPPEQHAFLGRLAAVFDLRLPAK